MSEPELWMATAIWAIRRYRMYLQFAPVTIYLPTRALVAAYRGKDCHARIQAWLMELQMYRAHLEAATGPGW